MENGDIHTRRTLAQDLVHLGLRRGESLLLHASMRSLGKVIGGPTAVILALLDVLGAAGTLVVPTQTTENKDPSRIRQIPARLLPYAREHMRGFDAATTPSSGMGVVAERMRRWPGAVRSAHPNTSFAALGGQAVALMSGHEFESELGEESPLGRLERADGRTLLLGVGYETCTSFHLAEYRMPNLKTYMQTCLVSEPEGRRWITYRASFLDSGDFGRLGEDFESSAEGTVHTGQVGNASAKLFSIPEAVAFAERWMRANRSYETDH